MKSELNIRISKYITASYFKVKIYAFQSVFANTFSSSKVAKKENFPINLSWIFVKWLKCVKTQVYFECQKWFVNAFRLALWKARRQLYFAIYEKKLFFYFTCFENDIQTALQVIYSTLRYLNLSSRIYLQSEKRPVLNMNMSTWVELLSYRSTDKN